MKTVLTIAFAQSRVVLAPAARSKCSILKTDTGTGKCQVFCNRSFVVFRRGRGPSLSHVKASGLHEAGGVGPSREEPGVCSSDGGHWTGIVFRDSNEALSRNGEDHLKDEVRDEDGVKVLSRGRDVVENVDDTFPVLVTHGETAERTDSLRSSDWPPSHDGRVEDLAQTVESLSENLLSVLGQQESLLRHKETVRRSAGKTHGVGPVNQSAMRGGDFGPIERVGTSVNGDGLSTEEETAAVGRRMESRNRGKKRDPPRILSPSLGSKRDKVKFNELRPDTNISIEEDERFMTEALAEAKKAAMAGEVPVGAVIVQKGNIIARAYNRVESEGDPTAHAEMLCLRRAAKRYGDWRLMDATLYVTLEPCPMCAGAILQSRVKGVVWGSRNTLLGADGSWVSLLPESVKEGINADSPESDGEPCRRPPMHPFHTTLEVRRGVLADDCSTVMKTFFQARRTDKLPHIKTKPWWLPLSAWMLFKRLLHWLAMLVEG